MRTGIGSNPAWRKKLRATVDRCRNEAAHAARTLRLLRARHMAGALADRRIRGGDFGGPFVPVVRDRLRDHWRRHAEIDRSAVVHDVPRSVRVFCTGRGAAIAVVFLALVFATRTMETELTSPMRRKVVIVLPTLRRICAMPGVSKIGILARSCSTALTGVRSTGRTVPSKKQTEARFEFIDEQRDGRLTDSEERWPRSFGRYSEIFSGTTRTLASCAWAGVAIASMSWTFSVGLRGLSK